MYNPLIGKFVSADTIVPNRARPQSLNRYSYVENRPLNLVDPTGHCGTTPQGNQVCPTGSTMSVNAVPAVIPQGPDPAYPVTSPGISYLPKKVQAEIRPLPTSVERQMLMNGKGASLLTMVAPILLPLLPYAPAAVQATVTDGLVGSGADALVQLAETGSVDPRSVVSAAAGNMVAGRIPIPKNGGIEATLGKVIAGTNRGIANGLVSGGVDCLSSCSNSSYGNSLVGNALLGAPAAFAESGLVGLGIPSPVAQTMVETTKTFTQRRLTQASSSGNANAK
jgi:hypothetical protein